MDSVTVLTRSDCPQARTLAFSDIGGGRIDGYLSECGVHVKAYEDDIATDKYMNGLVSITQQAWNKLALNIVYWLYIIQLFDLH